MCLKNSNQTSERICFLNLCDLESLYVKVQQEVGFIWMRKINNQCTFLKINHKRFWESKSKVKFKNKG